MRTFIRKSVIELLRKKQGYSGTAQIHLYDEDSLRITQPMFFGEHELVEIEIKEKSVTAAANEVKRTTTIVAADALAFQYEGMLEWIDNPDCECCHCDDHEKLVKVLEDYRRVRGLSGDGIPRGHKRAKAKE